MMTTATSPLANSNPTASGSTDSTSHSRIPSKLLNQDDFLKLLVTQLSNQDPMNPQTDTAFIGQMAQFTTLEQSKAMSGDIAQIRAQQQILQAMSLLDKEVVVQSEKSGIAMGVVKGFNMDGQNPKLVIGDKQYDLRDIQTIRLANQN